MPYERLRGWCPQPYKFESALNEYRLGLGASLRLDLNPDRTWLTVSLCRLATASQPMGLPFQRTSPRSGVRVPSTMRIVVGLPAQLRPTIAST